MFVRWFEARLCIKLPLISRVGRKTFPLGFGMSGGIGLDFPGNLLL
jgi:hypothetical protein